MWYEILPSAGLIFVMMGIPNLIDRPLCWLFDGKPYRRTLHDPRFCNEAMRDHRLSGAPYKTIGLEGLPDEPEQK